ncbi:MAG: hypothetical protein JNK45_33915 [Myxococcales bacterium]|nr:hypothetical protein [Myxococcales bacterium]
MRRLATHRLALALVLASCVSLASCFSEEPDGDDDDSASAASVDTSSSASSTGTAGSTTSSVDSTAGDVTGPSATADSGTSDAEGSSTTAEPASFCDGIGGSVDEFPLLTCLDFDEGDGLDGWSVVETSDDAVTFGAPASDGPPHPPAMRAAVPAGGPDDEPAGLSLGLGGLSVPLHLEFALHLEACIADVRLVELAFPGATPFEAFLQMTPSGLALGTRDGAGVLAMHDLDPDVLLAAGPWARWRIATDPLSGYVDVFVDDLVATQVSGLTTPKDTGDAPVLRVGALDGDPAGCAVWFDEIVAY